MAYRLLADAVVVLHFAFIVFVVAGGLLVLRHGRVAWAHVPAALWGAVIEFTGGVCPLTPLEQSFRRAAGEVGYRGGFVEHYVVPVIYPEGLTTGLQVALGTGVLVVNAVVYGLVLRRRSLRAGR